MVSNWGQTGFQEGASSYIHGVQVFYSFMLMVLMWVMSLLAVSCLCMVKKGYSVNVFDYQGMELFWCIGPPFVIVVLAVPSLFVLYFLEVEEEVPILNYKSVGSQWFWSYEFSEMKVKVESYMVEFSDLGFVGEYRCLEVDYSLILPAFVPVGVTVSSSDVIHCWALPSLGVKVDAIPGRLNQVVVKILRYGYFFGQCSEICGINHSNMPIVVESVAIWEL